MRYAQLDEQNVCVSISDLSGPVDASNMIQIDSGESLLGKLWEGGQWSDAPKTAKPLTFVQFVGLAYEHGGMTATKYAEARGNPQLSIFFDMLQPANGIIKDDPFTIACAEAFVSAGVLTQEGVDAIFANWPEG